jgi:hypothetical protein
MLSINQLISSEENGVMKSYLLHKVGLGDITLQTTSMGFWNMYDRRHFDCAEYQLGICFFFFSSWRCLTLTS